MPKHTYVILWLVGNSGETVINAFLLGFFSPSHQIPNDIWHSNFAMPKHTNVIDTSTFAMPKHTGVILFLAGNSGEMVINAFLSGFFSPSRQIEWYEC